MRSEGQIGGQQHPSNLTCSTRSMWGISGMTIFFSGLPDFQKIISFVLDVFIVCLLWHDQFVMCWSSASTELGSLPRGCPSSYQSSHVPDVDWIYYLKLICRLFSSYRMTKRLPSLTGDLKQISECRLYRDPRVSLRARLHAFCRDCEETATVNPDSCPLCRPFFRIPKVGYGSIPKNYVEEKLVDLHQEYLEKKLNLKDEKVIGTFFIQHCSLPCYNNPSMAWKMMYNWFILSQLYGSTRVVMVTHGLPWKWLSLTPCQRHPNEPIEEIFVTIDKFISLINLAKFGFGIIFWNGGTYTQPIRVCPL